MAERPSVKDILAAARKGGAVKPTDAAELVAAPAPEPTLEATAIEATTVAPTVAAVAPPLGRPMTLKEKLAAARVGATPAAASAPVAAAPVAATASGEIEKAVPAPAPSLGRPMTLKEKLAASRGATVPAGASVAPAATPSAMSAAVPKTAVARELPPLAEITDPKDLAEALRQAGAKKDREVAGAIAKAAPVRPGAKPKAEAKTVPGRPSKTAALSESTAESGPSRRTVLKFPWVVAGWASFTLGLTAFTAMLGRFMFPNVLAEPPSTVKVGVPSDFAKEDVSERWKAEWGFWIVRTERFNGQDILFALQSVCTHLGCPPNWLAGEQKFKCPCHGSGFYISGVNFEGPAPRPLERFRVAIADDGQIIVDKSQKFQEELAQWTDPDSFLAAV